MMKTKDVVKHFGSVQKAATALGITRIAVYNWGEEVPLLRAYQIEKVTGGKLKAPPVRQSQ